MNRLLLILLLLIGSVPATAQTRITVQLSCFPPGAIKERMANIYKESPIMQAVTGRGLLLEMLATKDGSSWTIHMVNPDGSSCVLASGEGVFPIEYKAPEKEG